MPSNRNSNGSTTHYRPPDDPASLYQKQANDHCKSCSSSGSGSGNGSGSSNSSCSSVSSNSSSTYSSSGGGGCGGGGGASSTNGSTSALLHPYRAARQFSHSTAMRHCWSKNTSARKLLLCGLLASAMVFLTWLSLGSTAPLTAVDKAFTATATNVITASSTTTQSQLKEQQQHEVISGKGSLPRGIAFMTAPMLLERLRAATGNDNATHQAGVIGNIATNDKSAIFRPEANVKSTAATDAVVSGSPLPNTANVKVADESLVVCTELFSDTRQYIDNRPRHEYANLSVIYFVTPTYPRREQIAELTRLAYTLLHVPRLHWIVANDVAHCNVYMDNLLTKFGIPYTHLASPMPDHYRKKKPMPRGVANRRAAMTWLRQHNITNGVLYFGDDDNTYDLRLFSEIRDTQRVSMFPVSLIGQYSVSGPVVRHGKVVGFLDSWVADRRWPVDMAGFAVNLAYMAEHPNASMPYKPGYEEDYFLRSIALKLDYIEPKGGNCTEILVWHTQTKNQERSTVHISAEYLDDRSNLGALFKSLQMMGVSVASSTEGSKAIISKNGKAKPLGYFLS